MECEQAIDGGWLPGDLLEDIPCKYFDGCVICEVTSKKTTNL